MASRLSYPLGCLQTGVRQSGFVEYLWHREDTGKGLTWQLRRCRVAPGFSGEAQPVGLLVHRLQLQDLKDVKDRVKLAQFMLWANNEQTKAPQGFRWLTQYTDKLAERHALPVTPVGLRPWGGQPLLTLGDATIIAHGHCALVLRLCSDAGHVVKIGKTSNISNEVNIHAVVDQSDCQHLLVRLSRGAMVKSREPAQTCLSLGCSISASAAFSHTIWFQMTPRQDISLRQGLLDMLLSHVNTFKNTGMQSEYSA